MRSRHSASSPSGSLFRGLGAWDAAAIAVAGMTPTMAMNLNPQQPVEQVGPIVPAVFAGCLFLVLMVAWCFARLAGEHPNAGSAYGFVAAVIGPRAGFVAGWALLGTYLSFASVGVGAVALFGANLESRLGLPCQHSPLTLVLGAVVVTAVLSLGRVRRASLILITLEGIAVLCMVALAVAVIVKVRCGGSLATPSLPLKSLLIPAQGVGAISVVLALSYAFVSFGGFEEAATLGEEVRRPVTTIPRILYGSVIGIGLVFTLVTAAEILGFGMQRMGIAGIANSTSLLADLSTLYFGGWCGVLFDILAIVSALGGALAPVIAASRILYALSRDLLPLASLGSVSGRSGIPRTAVLVVVLTVLAGHLAMSFLFGASGSDAFFWTTVLGVLSLLFVYLLIVVSAAVSLERSQESGKIWKLLIPSLAGLSILYTLWVNLQDPMPGAYRILPWIVLVWCLVPVALLLLWPNLAVRIRTGFLGSALQGK